MVEDAVGYVGVVGCEEAFEHGLAAVVGEVVGLRH